MPKLLLADASPMMHRIVELTFAAEKVGVVAARDGEEAMALILAERPDIVFADHALPKRTGYEVAAFVKGRADLAHIPVVLLTGAFEPVDRVRAAQVGCDDVLVKPFEPHDAVARVRALLASRPVPADEPNEEALPTLDALLDAPAAQSRLTDLSELADALSALARRPQPEAMPVPGQTPSDPAPVPAPASAPVESAAEEDLVEQVTRRVLERLSSDAVDHLVSGVVRQVAGQMVREEIERARDTE